MKTVFLIFLFVVSSTSCVSKKKYNELSAEKEKLITKTSKLETKLKSLNDYQILLKDSLDKL
ncbi:MAG: hypothetical protein IT243_00375 [Bacteroidia bacterium]|nr:hypothetical protein [Bacteroidia bacterium]